MISKLTVTILLLAPMYHSAWALETLEDNELAQTTGQNGIDLGLDVGTNGVISFNHIALEDRDGFAGATGGAGLAWMPAQANTGMQFYDGSVQRIQNPITFKIDADGNANNPVMNIGIVFNNVYAIRLQNFSLGLVKLNANGSIDQASRRDILKTGASGIDIYFKTGAPLGVNVQLGNQPQGALFKLSGKLHAISPANPIEILSYNNCTVGVTCNPSSSLKFNFDLRATNEAQGISLDNIYGDTTTAGLVITNPGMIDAFNVKLNNITFGSAPSSSATVFNGLPNSSIGNIGLEGVKVTDFKAVVKGI